MNINFEIDSGSGVSTLRKNDAIRVGATITPAARKIFGYEGNDIPILGQTNLKFSFANIHFDHTFIVVNCNTVNLFGRDLAEKLKMKIVIPEVNSENLNKINTSVLDNFKEYLSDDFQSCVTQEVNLNVSCDATPVFTKARSVPIRLKNAVKTELDRLVNTGKLTKVYSSDWASPTVNVLKSDGTVRICRDFSSTVNKFLQPVQSPLISIDDVISQVGDAKYFSSLDLSGAFLQLKLNEKSKEYTTINTSEGLYRYNYMPFGLCSSPGTFQSFMLKVLNGIDDVICYQDDILILTTTIDSHNKILNKVLHALKNAGIKLNIKKSKFFTDRIDYLGHIFDKNGVHPSPDKIDAIVRAPCPTNLKQLQAFMGMCNFYSRFVRNFSHVMSPLYYLLKKGG